MHHTLQPDGWPRPRGYANGVSARGRTIHVAGQIGWDAQQRLVSDDFVEQATQAMRNIVDVLACDGATPAHLVRLTWYVTDRDQYIESGAALGAAYREIFGRVTRADVDQLKLDAAQREVFVVLQPAVG